mmetsp:Transcript_40338/g.103252  ORF Transcript_40338/g.103252 Transcript_40338/m.103252 type:complete len:186 (-) Transcript_40338:1135-1692(-)
MSGRSGKLEGKKPRARRPHLLHKLCVSLGKLYCHSASADARAGLRGKLDLSSQRTGTRTPPPEPSALSKQTAGRSKQLKALQHRRMRPIAINLPQATSKSMQRTSEQGPAGAALPSEATVEAFLRRLQHSSFCGEDQQRDATAADLSKQDAWNKRVADFMAAQQREKSHTERAAYKEDRRYSRDA